MLSNQRRYWKLQRNFQAVVKLASQMERLKELTLGNYGSLQPSAAFVISHAVHMEKGENEPLGRIWHMHKMTRTVKRNIAFLHCRWPTRAYQIAFDKSQFLTNNKKAAAAPVTSCTTTIRFHQTPRRWSLSSPLPNFFNLPILQ